MSSVGSAIAAVTGALTMHGLSIPIVPAPGRSEQQVLSAVQFSSAGLSSSSASNSSSTSNANGSVGSGSTGSNAPAAALPVLSAADLQILSRLPPEQVIVSDADLPPDQALREREAHDRKMKDKLTRQEVILHPNVAVAEMVFMTRQELLDRSFNHTMVDPQTGKRFKRVKCYHDGDYVDGTVRFRCTGYDPITQRWFVDPVHPFCTTPCVRTSIHTEKAPKFMDHMFWTNHMAREVYHEYGPPRFAPPRSYHTDYCFLSDTGLTTPAFRASAEEDMHVVELLHPRLEPVPLRLCTQMEKPMLIKAVGDVGETRRYVSVLSTSNRQAPMSIEKPPELRTGTAALLSTIVAESSSSSSSNSTSTVIPSATGAAPMDVGADGAQNSASTYIGELIPPLPPPPKETLLPTGQVQIRPVMTGLSRNYGVLA